MFDHHKVDWIVRSWATEEIEALEPPLSSLPLIRFWEAPTVNSLVDVLEQQVRVPE